MEDIRWKQRFENFVQATKELEDAVTLKNSRELTVLEKKGLIQSFEIAHELAWNLLKDYLQAVGGTTGLLGSRDTTREAFKRGLISDGDTWMEMIISRNKTSHIYDEATAEEVIDLTCRLYYPCFAALLQRFYPLYEQAE
jgi:nucleotidyltransferase substrate binding protein (TIGR01987 family)